MTAGLTAPRTVGILIYDHVEVLDFAGPFEVFAGIYTPESKPLFKVLTIAPENRVITCSGGLLVQPHHSLEGHPALDIVIIPGGYVETVKQDRRVLDWIIGVEQRTEVLASVCTGAEILAEIGLLDDGPATTHWSNIERMRQRYARIEMLPDQRIVDRGHMITSAGVSAGIDMALHIVARLHGAETARDAARAMEYDWAQGMARS